MGHAIAIDPGHKRGSPQRADPRRNMEKQAQAVRDCNEVIHLEPDDLSVRQ